MLNVQHHSNSTVRIQVAMQLYQSLWISWGPVEKCPLWQHRRGETCHYHLNHIVLLQAIWWSLYYCSEIRNEPKNPTLFSHYVIVNSKQSLCRHGPVRYILLIYNLVCPLLFQLPNVKPLVPAHIMLSKALAMVSDPHLDLLPNCDFEYERKIKLMHTRQSNYLALNNYISLIYINLPRPFPYFASYSKIVSLQPQMLYKNHIKKSNCGLQKKMNLLNCSLSS